MSSVHDGHPQKNCSVGEDVVGFGVGDGVAFVGSLDGAVVGAFVGEDVTGVDTGAVVG